MKVSFIVGIIGLIAFEIANVYFIMPLPGSQEMNSIAVAYFLYRWRWAIRAVFVLMILLGVRQVFSKHRILTVLALGITGFLAYYTHFKMAAESIFLLPKDFRMAPAAANVVDTSRLVLGIADGGESRAYPIQYIGYHHQVLDTLAGKPVIVTYCTVCRTGRVYEPLVKGKPEQFRLVGMDHFNAMFEDQSTQSWWRQVTGEAIAGSLRGETLPALTSVQMTLGKWLKLNPNSLIMQPDSSFIADYDSLSNYEVGRRKGRLTRRDSLSWEEKSWVVGIRVGQEQKAYDWNALVAERIIYDVLDDQPIALVLTPDNQSYVALKRTHAGQLFTLSGDTLADQQNKFNLLGKAYSPAVSDLQIIPASQEYWHSWRTFQPGTKRYPVIP